VHVVPVAADCAHKSSSSVEALLTDADQEVPWRMLIGRPSVGQRPVAALGASHHREALVSCGPSERLATEALSRWWSAMCPEQSALPYSQPTRESSLSRKENENYLTTQRPEVAL
jgi:hypothetical protein